MQLDRTPLSQVHRGHWREILIGLGIPDKMLVNRHGPCPVCGGKDRFRFDDKDGLGTFYCSRCGAGDGPRLVMLFLSVEFKEAAEHVRQVMGDGVAEPLERPARAPRAESRREETSEAKRARMNALWGKAMPVRATDPAGAYLTRRLGRLPSGTGLRFQQRCPYPQGDDWPAMLAVFVGADGTPSGLHRTYLDQDGRKAPVVSPKLSLGPLVDGGAVRLAPAGPVLAIAEGIETALAASIIFGVPCWAALNANRLAVWEPPAQTSEVIIFADNDHSFTGQLAAFDLDARLRGRCKVTIETSLKPGEDWNDILLSKRRAA